MFFKRTNPRFPPALEQIHAVGADIAFFVKFATPDAVNVVVLVQKHLPVHGAELFRGVHVENEYPAGVQRLPDTPDGLFAVLRVRDIVEAVQGADGEVDASGKTQPLQTLTDKPGRVLEVCAFLLGGGEHFLGHVHADDGKSLSGKDRRHRAGAAGKIDRRPGL